VDHSLMTDPVTVLKLWPAVTIPLNADLGHAIGEMIGRRIGAVLVTHPAGTLAGILTERDFLTKVAGQTGYLGLPVTDFMTWNPETVAANDTLAFALGKMASGGYRHLPVVTDGVPVGTISVRDILRHIVALCHDS
jgi:CBS domain-containing protein